jgi:hypothetical protein
MLLEYHVLECCRSMLLLLLLLSGVLFLPQEPEKRSMLLEYAKNFANQAMAAAKVSQPHFGQRLVKAVMLYPAELCLAQ